MTDFLTSNNLFCSGANLKYVSLRDFSLDCWEQIWAQHLEFERCLQEKFHPLLELLEWWINSIYFQGLSEVWKSYAKLLMTTSISIKMNIIRNVVLKLCLGQHHFPQKEESLWGWKANQSGRGDREEMVRRREMGIQTCKVQLDSSTFCHMWQMHTFIQPKDLFLSSDNVVKRLKNNLCTFPPLMRFKYLHYL